MSRTRMGSRRPTRAEKQNQRAERAYAELKAGLGMGPCWLLTLTKHINPEAGWGNDRNLDMGIRGAIWTPLLRQIRTYGGWPAAEAWTVQEWGEKSVGVHLHVVMRGTVGITPEWIQETMHVLGKPYEAHIEPIKDALITEGPDAGQDVVVYLTKQLRTKAILDNWPPYTHLVSSTQGWLPAKDDGDTDAEHAAA